MQKSLCITCKGKNPKLCGKNFCPIYTKFNAGFKLAKRIDKDFSGNTPPAIFIGSKLEYPKVNFGILSPLAEKEEAIKYDSPAYWYENKTPIQNIIEYRTSLVNSRFESNVFDARKNQRLVQLGQELAMTMKPVSLDFNLKNKPTFKLDFDDVRLPFGPTAELKKVTAKENINIPKQIDKISADTDLKATDAITILKEKNYNEHQISQLLSVGILGLKKDRKLVPTRYSITATDDILGKQLLNKIRNYEKIQEYKTYFGSYLGNYFLVMMFPSVWSYELFETYLPKTLWNPNQDIEITTDYETFNGRTSYAENCTGGYYAARLPITESLDKNTEQSTALVLRFITDEYAVPLGVFVVRQAVRNAMSNKPTIYENRKSMLKQSRDFILKRFSYDINSILKQSKLLNKIKTQATIAEFF